MTTSSDAIGTILDGRYRLVALLGSGPTSSTYLGEDLSLQRQVAVRVAHPDFANDPEFRQRFAAEARAIAGLNHPSILRVYDWSEEPTGAFVVLEYVPGGSLRTILNERGALSLSQVVAIGSQAARALASAHASGITHGAVKPGNLLFDEDDRVRLTDFSPSEAAYDPFAAGAELDGERAKYASPEEALGSPLDARADVYSLAVVLYEAAPGVLPFQGGSPISTLMARVGMPLPHHPALGALDQMLARAAAPDPDARMDAAGLADRLDALASSLDPPEPLNPARRPQPTYLAAPPTVTVKSSFETSETQVVQSPTGTTTAVGSKTLASGTIGFRSPSASELTGAVPVAATSALLANARPSTSGSDGSGSADIPGDGEGDFEFDDERRRRRWWIWAVATLVVVLLAGAGILLVGGLNKAEVTVPSVVGSTKAQAVDQIQAAKLTVGYGKGSYSTSVPKDQVLSQSPGGGTKASEGHEVMLTLSLGPPLVTVPAVLGQSCTAAEAALTAVKLSSSCPTAAATYSATIPPGNVVSYMVNGTVNAPAVPEGSVVILSVSSGTAPTAVPDVTGLSYVDAGNKLRAAGFSVAEGSEYSSTVPVSSVTRTTPAAGAPLSAGGLVTVYISNGPAPATVPNVVGDTAAQAVKALTALGLSPNIIGSGSTVATQDPVPGTVVPAGTAITVTLA